MGVSFHLRDQTLTGTALQCSNGERYGPSYRRHSCVECLSPHQKVILPRSLFILCTHVALDGTLASCYAESCFCPLLSPFLPLKEEGRLSIATSLIIERDWGRAARGGRGARGPGESAPRGEQAARGTPLREFADAPGAPWQPQPGGSPLLARSWAGWSNLKEEGETETGEGREKASCRLQNPKPRGAAERRREARSPGRGRAGTRRSPVPAAAASAVTRRPRARTLPFPPPAHVAAGTASPAPSPRTAPALSSRRFLPRGPPRRTFAGSVCLASVPALDAPEPPFPATASAELSLGPNPYWFLDPGLLLLASSNRGLASPAELLPVTPHHTDSQVDSDGGPDFSERGEGKAVPRTQNETSA